VLKEQGISRQDVFITSKVSPYEQGTEKATLACQQILQRLQTDYVVGIQALNSWITLQAVADPADPSSSSSKSCNAHTLLYHMCQPIWLQQRL
jgi:hypothetical protein